MTKQEFMTYFMAHYPEGTVIHNSGWHAARLYRAMGSSPAMVYPADAEPIATNEQANYAQVLKERNECAQRNVDLLITVNNLVKALGISPDQVVDVIAAQGKVTAPVAAQEPVRNATLEEAALACEKLTTGPNGEYRLDMRAKEDFRACAEAIRALKASQPAQGEQMISVEEMNRRIAQGERQPTGFPYAGCSDRQSCRGAGFCMDGQKLCDSRA
jgi:ribosomal protein L25 (general stress protein Ctc)